MKNIIVAIVEKTAIRLSAQWSAEQGGENKNIHLNWA